MIWLHKQKESQPLNVEKHKWWSNSGWTFLTVFIWEILEEVLENIIAFGISALFSTIFLLLATQGIKLCIKKVIRFLVPFVKRYTYKEGNDKVKFLKNYWTKVWGNKITGTSAGIGFAGLSYFQTFIPFATHCWWIALIVFVVFFNLAVFFGGETLSQIQERIAQSTIKKEEQAIIKEAQKRLKQIEKKASQTEAEKMKNDAKEKANAEKEAKVKQAMAEIQAKAQADAQK